MFRMTLERDHCTWLSLADPVDCNLDTFAMVFSVMPVQHVLKRGNEAQACVAAYVCILSFDLFFAWSKSPALVFS